KYSTIFYGCCLSSYIEFTLTLIIVCVGWLQFGDLNKTTKGDFLLRIDERFGHETIIKARAIIHKFYCETYDENICKETHRRIIGEKIMEIILVKKQSTNFIYLMNFLDFLETIAYFTNKNYMSEKDIKELLGGSIPYYYEVFKPFINYRRAKYNSENYFCELERLIYKINKK
ncbi:DUF4760 domain-containing protein, partial [Legionella pneumophila]|uniref:DUF4760 domain-containing protein n=2 Tax=Legionella pneumophila TaxID=446 RepID=UPI0022B5451F